jgi:hypothetical protein
LEGVSADVTLQSSSAAGGEKGRTLNALSYTGVAEGTYATVWMWWGGGDVNLMYMSIYHGMVSLIPRPISSFAMLKRWERWPRYEAMYMYVYMRPMIESVCACI